MSRKSIFIILTGLALLVLPSVGWAACKYADGSSAPEPGRSQATKESETWQRKFVELLSNLSRGDKSTVDAALKVGTEPVLTTRCANQDLFWGHLSLVGMSEVVDMGLPEPVKKLTRAYKLTPFGQKTLPDLMSAPE